jgi:hypothetical protein
MKHIHKIIIKIKLNKKKRSRGKRSYIFKINREIKKCKRKIRKMNRQIYSIVKKKRKEKKRNRKKQRAAELANITILYESEFDNYECDFNITKIVVDQLYQDSSTPICDDASKNSSNAKIKDKESNKEEVQIFEYADNERYQNVNKVTGIIHEDEDQERMDERAPIRAIFGENEMETSTLRKNKVHSKVAASEEKIIQIDKIKTKVNYAQLIKTIKKRVQ